MVHQGAFSGVEYYHLRFIVTEIKLFSVLPPPNSQPPISRCLFLFFLLIGILAFYLPLEEKEKKRQKESTI